MAKTRPVGVTLIAFPVVLGAIMALVYLWLSRTLWEMAPQGWRFAVLLSAFNLFSILLSILGASSWEAMLPGIIINGIILVYCLLPGTKQAFGVPG